MGVWKDHKWTDAKALNGFLIAVLFPVPLFYYSTQIVESCPAESFFTFDVTASWCHFGSHFVLLCLVTLFIPLWLLMLVQGNGWLNDLYWTLVPIAALYHYTLIAVRLRA
jgi:hypothetical protein